MERKFFLITRIFFFLQIEDLKLSDFMLVCRKLSYKYQTLVILTAEYGFFQSVDTFLNLVYEFLEELSSYNQNSFL